MRPGISQKIFCTETGGSVIRLDRHRESARVSKQKDGAYAPGGFHPEQHGAILTEWESFAASCKRGPSMTPLALRDHAEEILQAVAQDISTAQSSDAQREKSLGRAPRLFDAPETAAQTHATLRAQRGFNIEELASEYRALRASVMRLWAKECSPTASHLEDVIRFNEAIDQALAESIGFFSAQVDQARNLLLGMLGHDMRSPLQTIQMTAPYLRALNAGDKVSKASAQLIRSGARMKALLDDLVDFNRAKLGVGINISPKTIDLATFFADEMEALGGAHPDRQLEFCHTGEIVGFWDGQRLQQLLANLVQNAVKYGAADAPIRVSVAGTESEVSIEVINSGPLISKESLDLIFEPLHRPNPEDRDQGASLGLGLYIAREIAKAHWGEIQARSEPSETAFAVRLPKTRPAAV